MKIAASFDYVAFVFSIPPVQVGADSFLLTAYTDPSLGSSLPRLGLWCADSPPNVVAPAGPSTSFELYAEVPEDFQFSFDGAAELLDQRARAYALMAPLNFTLDLEIKFLVWQAILRCSAGIGVDGQVGSFDFYYRYEDHLVAEVNRLMPGALEAAYRSATAALQRAEQEVASWRAASDHLTSLIDARKAEVRKGQDELLAKVHDATAQVEAAKAKVSEIKGLVESAQRDYDKHNNWHDWLDGVAEYYSAKLGALWAAYHLAESILDMAELVLQVLLVMWRCGCPPLTALATQGFGDLVHMLPLGGLDPEVWALEVARASVDGFSGLAVLGLKAAEGLVDGARLLIEETVGLEFWFFHIDELVASGSLADILAGLPPQVNATLTVVGSRLQPRLRLDFRNIELLAASLVDFLISAFQPSPSRAATIPAVIPRN